MRRILALILVLAACVGSAPMEARPKPKRETEPPHLDRLQRWDGGWIASGEGSGLYRVDLERSALSELKHPEVEKVLAVAQAGNASFLFGRIRDSGRLFRVSGGFSEEIRLPLSVYARPETWRLAASDQHLAFFDNVAINRLDLDHPDEWQRIPLKTELWPVRPYPCDPRTSALTTTHLFAAFDEGEFRGGLKTVNLADGTVSHVDDDYEPATGLATDEQGRVWATWGQVHFNQYDSSLRVYENGAWRLVSHVTARDREPRVNWPFAETGFRGIATDRGRLYLLTSRLGVVELQDGIWRQRLPGMLSEIYGTALAVDGDRLIIATYDEGVTVANLRTRFVQTLQFSDRSR